MGSHIRHAVNKYDEASRKLVRFNDKLQLACEVPPKELLESGSNTPDEVERDE